MPYAGICVFILLRSLSAALQLEQQRWECENGSANQSQLLCSALMRRRVRAYMLGSLGYAVGSTQKNRLTFSPKSPKLPCLLPKLPKIQCSNNKYWVTIITMGAHGCQCKTHFSFFFSFSSSSSFFILFFYKKGLYLQNCTNIVRVRK